MNPDVLKAQLRAHEGVRRFAYMDTVGKISVGVGRNLSDKGLSPREIDFLLDNDVDECVADVAALPWFSGLDEVRQHVLLDLRFNLGAAGLRRFPALLNALSERDFPRAAKSLRESRFYVQTKSRGVHLVGMLQTGVPLVIA